MIERENALAARTRRRPDVDRAEITPAPRPLLSRRIAELVRLIRVSSQEHYRRDLGLRGLELRIVLELGSRGSRRRCELAEALSSDRSWIGRATKALAALGIIATSSPRGPIALSPGGVIVFDRFAALADACERELLQGIAQREIDVASHALALLRNAAAAPDLKILEGRWGGEALPARLMRTARAMARVARTANAAVCELSSLEVTTLVRIAEGEHLTLTRLAEELHRDKGQMSRMVWTLTEAGLVHVSPPRGRNKGLAVTDKGRQLIIGFSTRRHGRTSFIAAC